MFHSPNGIFWSQMAGWRPIFRALLIVNYSVPFSFCLFLFYLLIYLFLFIYFYFLFFFLVGSLWVDYVCWVAYFKQIQIQYNTIQHKAKSARLVASEFSFLLAVLSLLGGCVQWSRRETKTLKLQQATEELGRERTAWVTTMAWCLTL